MLAKTVGLMRCLFRLPEILAFIMVVVSLTASLVIPVLERSHVALTEDRRLIDIVVVVLRGIEILSRLARHYGSCCACVFLFDKFGI